MAIIASCDLGGLGSKEGPAVDYYWVLPNIAPMLLPWLAILGLLAAKPNRCAAAWLIWLATGLAGLGMASGGYLWRQRRSAE